MIVNGKSLYRRAPLDPMLDSKIKAHGVSHGLSEAGYDLRIRESVVLHPLRRFTLASAIERFKMPDDLVGIVHDKSSFIRRGMFVGNSVVEPGWEGWLTLELYYAGWGVLHIPAGSGIAQVVFHQVTDPIRYVGRYNNQPARPVAAILEKG
jgi:dCTP deaminase